VNWLVLGTACWLPFLDVLDDYAFGLNRLALLWKILGES
jgi:hypothetical protein